MIRKLAFALSLLGAFSAGLVQALGLGEAEVKSSLNQPLRAEIELVNVGSLEENEILPGLATREEFLKAGVDRVYFLSDIRFKVATNEAGKLVVVLTTTKPVREPFLNFLAEVIWPSGRLLREYALLIDPPLFSEEPVKPVASPSLNERPAATSSQRTQSGDRISVPARSVVAPSNTASIAGGTYGPTNSRDTLWDIALKARPDRSVSPQQVMLAIQDLNPGAFIDDNINKMKAGQILRLPSKEQIRARSTAQAINEVIAQNEALSGKSKKPVLSAAKSDVAKAAAPRQAVKAEDELKLVVADGDSKGTDSASAGQAPIGGSSSNTATDAKLALTLEKLDKATIENKDLSSRVSDLEEQLQTLQRLLTLKNDQLASIQEQVRANELAEQQAAMVPEGEGGVELSSEGSATANEAGTESAAELAVEASQQAEAGQENTPADESGDASSAKVDAASSNIETKTMDAPSQPVPAQQNLVETIVNNPLYLAAVAVGIVILLIILWLISRSNARREQALHEQYEAVSEAGSDDSFDHEDLEQEESAAGVFDEDEDQEDQSDSQQSDATDSLYDGDNESTEVTGEQTDVIAEADVYIAYGRLDQAATILEGAISAEPVRTDFRLKLLEVYKEADNVDAFDKQFSELEAIQDADALEAATLIRNEMLDKELASLDDQELDLVDSKEYEESADEMRQQEAAIEAEEQAIENVTDNSFDFESVEAVDEDGEAEELDIDLSSDELDLDLDIALDESELLDSGDAAAESEELEDQVDPASIAAEPEPELSVESESKESEEIDDSLLEAELEAVLAGDDLLDVELDDVDLSEELETESEIDLPTDLSLPDELTALDDDEAEELKAESVENSIDAAIAADNTENEPSDTIVSDDILDEAVEALGDPDDFEADLTEGDEFDFLEGTDEASTKLDLARAYIDMGDIDGARDILQEVETEGSSEQQAEAKELLSSLDG